MGGERLCGVGVVCRCCCCWWWWWFWRVDAPYIGTGGVGDGEDSLSKVADVEGGLVELCGTTRIAELADEEQGASGEVREDVRLLCGFRDGWEDEFAYVCGGNGVAVWHRDYNGVDGELFVCVGGGGINVVAGCSCVGYRLLVYRWGTI